jgi:hypothetical protein
VLFLSHFQAFTAAGLASVLSGLLVLPSLATAEAMRNIITALNRAGQTSTMCISILLAPMHVLGPTSKPGDPMRPPRQQHQRQEQQQQRQPQPQLEQQASLLLEDPLSPQSLSSIVEHSSQPGQWGLRSFLAANSAAATAAAATLQQADGQPGSTSAPPAARQQQTMASVPVLPSGTNPTPAAASSGVSAAGAAGQGVFGAAGAATNTTAAAGANTAAADDEEDWGDDHYEEESQADAPSSSEGNLVSADANVQLAWLHPMGSSGSGGSGGSSGLSVGQTAPVTAGAAAAAAAANAPGLRPHKSEAAALLFTPPISSNQGRPVTPPSAHATPLLPLPLSSKSVPNLKPIPHQHRGHSHPTAASNPSNSAAGSKGVKPGKTTSDLQRHPLVRLQRGVDQIRPLLQAVKQLQGAVVVEQAWWVGLLVRQRTREAVDAGAWQQLVEALEALVHRWVDAWRAF